MEDVNHGETERRERGWGWMVFAWLKPTELGYFLSLKLYVTYILICTHRCVDVHECPININSTVSI